MASQTSQSEKLSKFSSKTLTWTSLEKCVNQNNNLIKTIANNQHTESKHGFLGIGEIKSRHLKGLAFSRGLSSCGHLKLEQYSATFKDQESISCFFDTVANPSVSLRQLQTTCCKNNMGHHYPQCTHYDYPLQKRNDVKERKLG